MADVTFNSEEERLAAEKQALAETLQGQADNGGAARGDGPVGPGADVPTVLDQDADVRARLEESILQRTGQGDRLAAESQAAFAQNQDVVSSEEAAAQNETDLSNLSDLSDQNSSDVQTILDQFAGPEFIEPDSESALADIQAQRDLFAQNLDNQIGNIQGSFEARRNDQRFINKSQQGGLQALLARTGATNFASGKGSMTAEIQRGQDALNQLTLLENQAINAAKEAAAGNDITLMQEQIRIAEEARNAMNDIRQQTFSNMITSQGAAADITQQNLQNAQSTINTLGSLSPSSLASLDPAELAGLEQEAGLPGGFFDAFQQTQTEFGEAATEEAQFERGTELLNLALKLPSGVQFDIGGSTVTGLDIGDRKVFESTDNAGNVTFTTVDPATGAVVNVSTIPGIDKTTQVSGGGTGGGGSTGISADVAKAIASGASLLGTQKLDASGNPTGEVYSTQDVMQLLLQEPAIVSDVDAQEQAVDALFAFSNLGSEAEILTTTGEEKLVAYDPVTGEANELAVINNGETEEEEEPNAFQKFQSFFSGQ